MRETPNLEKICGQLILQLDRYLGIEDVSLPLNWPQKERNADNDPTTGRRFDPLYIKTCELFNDYRPGLNAVFVVKRGFVDFNFTWEFYFKGYDNIDLKNKQK